MNVNSTHYSSEISKIEYSAGTYCRMILLPYVYSQKLIECCILGALYRVRNDSRKPDGTKDKEKEV